MKKVILLALAVMASASFNTVAAKDKKKKADAKGTAAEVVTLKSASDSLSYAAGMSMTNGLLPYLKQQFGVDTTNIADFVAGYKEALKSKGDPKLKARMAGYQIASQVIENLVKNLIGDAHFEDMKKPLTIVAVDLKSTREIHI